MKNKAMVVEALTQLAMTRVTHPDLGISEAQARLLHWIWLRTRDDTPTSVGDLLEWWGGSAANATGLSDVLEKSGYINKVMSTEDRRKILVQLTPKAEEWLQTTTNWIKNQIEEILPDPCSGCSL